MSSQQQKFQDLAHNQPARTFLQRNFSLWSLERDIYLLQNGTNFNRKHVFLLSIFTSLTAYLKCFTVSSDCTKSNAGTVSIPSTTSLSSCAKLNSVQMSPSQSLPTNILKLNQMVTDVLKHLVIKTTEQRLSIFS